MTDKWQSHIDRQFEKMMEGKQGSDLPGAGKPLKLDDDTYTPADQRMAYKLMADNEVMPGWIMLRKDIEKDEKHIHDMLTRAWRAYNTQMEQARRANSTISENNAKQIWQREQQKIEDTIKSHNSKVLDYNLQVPPGVQHLIPINLQKEINRLLPG